MTGVPRAAGVRRTYFQIPGEVRTWVEMTLGSPVVSVAEQVGGMSPGCATRLVCKDGTRAFVKAVGPELNEDTVPMFRREITVLRLLGEHPLWASLLAAYDDPDGWVALLIEDVDGAHPVLTNDAVMEGLLSATDELTTVLRERVPDARVVDARGGVELNDMAARYRLWARLVDRLDELPPGAVPGWVLERSEAIQDGLRGLASEQMNRVCHWDIREDNVLQRSDGRFVFIDWGQAAVGPGWVDPMLARMERVESGWFDEAVRRSAVLRAAGDEAVTMWLAGFGAALTYRAWTAEHVNMPTLRAYRLRESARLLGAAARRWGLSG